MHGEHGKILLFVMLFFHLCCSHLQFLRLGQLEGSTLSSDKNTRKSNIFIMLNQEILTEGSRDFKSH